MESRGSIATTRSPIFGPVTSEPSSATVPARSIPGTYGSVIGIISARKPARMWSSTGLNDVAATRTSTW